MSELRLESKAFCLQSLCYLPTKAVRILDKVWVSCSVVSDFVTLWTVTCQAPLSMGFPRQEYWSGLPFPSPGDLPNPVIKLGSPILQADSLLSEPPSKSIYTPLILFNSPSLHHHCLFYLVPHSLCFRYSTSVFEGWREMGWGVCVWTLVRITSRSSCLAWPWGRISALHVNWLWPFATPWIAPIRLLCSWDFFRLAYGSGLPFPSSGDLHSSRDQTRFSSVSVLQAGSLPAEPLGKLKQIGTKSQLLNQNFTHVD